MSSVSTDSEIIARSRADPPAFGEIFDRHASRIHRYLARRTSPVVADDVMAEAFLVAFERRGTYDLERQDAAPWLFGIATNLLRRYHRHEVRALRALGRSAASDAVTGSMDEAALADTRIDLAAALVEVASALRRMPQHQRDAVLLHAWGQLTYDQIAEALGVPVGTVRSRLHRARRTLRTDTRSSPAELLTGDHHG